MPISTFAKLLWLQYIGLQIPISYEEKNIFYGLIFNHRLVFIYLLSVCCDTSNRSTSIVANFHVFDLFIFCWMTSMFHSALMTTYIQNRIMKSKWYLFILYYSCYLLSVQCPYISCIIKSINNIARVEIAIHGVK